MYFLPNQDNLNTRTKSNLSELLYHEVFEETPVGPQYFSTLSGIGIKERSKSGSAC
jgi:hypothetical protein